MAGIYIHIPFCRHICNYCDFHHSASLILRESMVEAIVVELGARHLFLPWDSVETIYFGGGTPSVCTSGQIALMLETCRRIWGPQAGNSEITMEANPEDLTPEYLNELRQIGINRLSIGVQSFEDEHLKLMNRHHTAAGAKAAVRDAQVAGFSNITIDLMYGLPFMTEVQWKNNITQALELGVQHISAYHLTIEPHTVFGKRGLVPVDESVSELHFRTLCRMVGEAGFEHYEVSNFALPGFRSRHNSSYWSGARYLGVGPSAHSYNGSVRSWNPSSNRLYLRDSQTREEEVLTPRDKFNELVMTRLRTAEGLELTPIIDTMRKDRMMISAQKLIAQGVLQCLPSNVYARGERLAIKSSDFLISDAIITELFQDE